MLNMLKKKYENVTAEQVMALMKEPNTIVVDVRELDEYKSGHIKNSILIPLGTLSNQLNRLDKSKHIIVVCQSGGRSARAAAFLGAEGYKVSNMMGGMMSWTGPKER